MQKSDGDGVRDTAAPHVRDPSTLNNDVEPYKDNCLKNEPLPFLIKKVHDQLLKKSNCDNFIPFGYAVNQAIGEIRLTHDEQIKVLKEMEKAGLIVVVDFKGWKILPQEV